MLSEAWIVIVFCKLVASSTIGYSGTLSTNVRIETEGNHVIKPWDVPDDSLFYNYIPNSDESGSFAIPIEGVYFLGANIKVKTSEDGFLEISFTDDALGGISYCRVVAYLSKNSEQAIPISCFARFLVKTELALKLQNSKKLEVMRGSSRFVQYFGMVGHLTSFVLPLRNMTVLKDKVLIPAKISIREYRYFNTFADMSNLADINITCSGIYIISLNVIVSMSEQSSFILSVGKTVLSNVDGMISPENTITIVQSVSLKKGDRVTMKLKGVAILPGSVYSFIRLGDADKVQGLFTSVKSILSDDQNKPYYRIPFNLSDARRPYFVNSTFVISPKDSLTMKLKHEGIYLFTLHIESSLLNKPIRLKIKIRGEDSMWTIARRTYRNSFFTLNGFLRLKDYDMVSVHIDKSHGFKLLPNSHLSITKILPPTFASTAEIPTTSQSAIKCNKKWTELSGFETRNDFNLNDYFKADRYDIPTSGIYLVLAEVSVKYAGEPNKQNIILALARKRANGDVNRLIESIVVTTKKQRMLSIRHILKFQKDDTVMLHMTCNKSFEFVHKTKLQIIFLRNIEDQTFLGISSLKNNVLGDPPDMYLNRYDQLRVPANGVYFVTVTRQIKYEDLKSVSAKVSMYVYSESHPKIRWLRTIEYLDMNEMGSEGTVTLHVSGFLEMKKKELIRLEIDYPKNSLTIHRVSEKVALVALNDADLSQYQFKSVVDSKSQFILNEEAKLQETVENFNSFSVIYKSDDVKFHGRSSFIVNKPMLILYDFAVELRGEKSFEVKIELKIYPRIGMTQMSENIAVPEKDNITVKVVGVLELKQSELVELAIVGKSDDKYVKSYFRSWSVIELVAPTSKRHSVELIRTSSNHELSSLASMQVIYPQIVHPNMPLDIRLIGNYSVLPTKISNSFPVWWHAFSLTVQEGRRVIPGKIGKELDLNVNKYGVVSLLQIEAGSFLKDVTVYLKTSNESNVVFASPEVNKPEILLLRISPNDSLVIRSSSVLSTSDNMTTNTSTASAKRNTESSLNVTFTPIEFITNLNGFSGIIRKDAKNGNLVGKTRRIANWFSDKSPFFHTPAGLIPFEGVFILQSNGYHFISLNILTQAFLGRRCKLLLTADEKVIFSEEITRRMTSFTDVIWLQKNLFVQSLLKCPAKNDLDLITIQAGSTLSIFLIESQPSFESKCFDIALEVISNINNESLNVAYGRNVELTCFDKSSMMGDFTWQMDDKVVLQIQGQRKATLELKNLTPKENGKYHCEMKRGNQAAKMKPIGIMVIDPRPKLIISNKTVYIGENYSANRLLAWIKVEAKNVKTNRLAKVRFSIIQGNEDNNFYTMPSISKSHTSLLFDKPFDYEVKKLYKVTVNAENLENEGDDGNATISILIHVVNYNEHRPRFTTTKSRFSVLENTGVGTKVYTFKAGDLDDDKIRYTLVLNNNLFRIDELTGDLIVNANIDYEKNEEIFLIVCASDNLYKTCMHVKISVLNENDNAPFFTQTTYTVNVTKVALPGTVVLTLRAADNDDSGDENLKFQIWNGNEEKYFFIDGNKLKLAKEYVGLTKSIHIQIGVRDRLFESLTPATVSINFIGDDPVPKFSKKVYQVEVPENIPIGTRIKTLDVTYKGKTVSKSSTKIDFSIKNLKSIDDECFTIDDEANIIVKEEIDFERTKAIVLLVSACVRVRKKDKCGICHVAVNVLDANDNSPLFQEQVYTTSISEHLLNGTRFFQLKATDADSEGANSRITYFLQDTFDLFDIENRTGKLYTTRDFEINDGRYFELLVGAKDGGTPVQTSPYFCTVKVDILLSNPVKIQAPRTEGLLGIKNWEFWILPCLGTLVLLLILVVATIFWKYRRSRRRFHEYVIEQPIVQDSNRNSFLTYLAKPASSQEETMYLSCGSLPSAYNSEKDIPKAVTSFKEKTSSVIFSENGYSTLANVDYKCIDNDATNV